MKLSKTNCERQPLSGPRDARKRIKKKSERERESDSKFVEIRDSRVGEIAGSNGTKEDE